MNATQTRLLLSALTLFVASGCGILSMDDSATGTAVPATATSEGNATTAAGEVPETLVLVGYHSLSGHTKKMAEAVAEGAKRVTGVTVATKQVSEITKEELETARGLILGSPTHFANIPGAMKVAIDNWPWKWRVNLQDKVGGAFSTGGNITGGKEHVVISLLLYMLNNRMIVAGPIYRTGPKGWGEIGASATTGGDDRGLSDPELEDARRLGERVANIARSYTPNP